MSQIRTIPEPFRPGIKYLLKISNEGYDELVNALNEMQPSLISRSLLDQLVPDTEIINHEEASAIIETAYSMSMNTVYSNVSISQFIQDVVDALVRGVVKDIVVTDDMREQLTERFSRLLNLGVFKIGVKANSVLNEQQHAFRRARVLTDIRPIFGENVEEFPIGMTLVHTLKLEYREADQVKEFFVALDTRDMQELLDVLERAKTKESEVKSLLSSAGINLIDYREGK